MATCAVVMLDVSPANTGFYSNARVSRLLCEREHIWQKVNFFYQACSQRRSTPSALLRHRSVPVLFEDTCEFLLQLFSACKLTKSNGVVNILLAPLLE